MAYKIFVKDKLDGTIEETDGEVYTKKADAEEALSEVINNFLTGGEVLGLSGEDFDTLNDCEFIIKKV